MSNDPRDEAAREPAEEHSPEPGTPGAAATAEGESPEELTLLLEDARNKADQHWEAFLRTKADLENLRKRSTRDLENARKYGHESFEGMMALSLLLFL